VEIKVTQIYHADVDGWAEARGISNDEAQKEIFKWLGSSDRSEGQSFLGLDSTEVILHWAVTLYES